ncbi:MAG: F390 synthetase-related protein [Candidatus Heimdallarchaeota archaeon]
MIETDSFLRFFFGCKRRFKRFSIEQIQNYQLERAQDLIHYVVNNSAFFEKYYQKENLDDVWNLPIVNKKIMMDNLSDYNTLGLNKEELIAFTTRIEQEKNYSERFQGINVAMSSGTSGNKGIVITSPYEEKYLQAALFSRFSFPRILRLKWAFLLRITTPAFQVSKFGQQLTHISLQHTLETIRKKLQDFQPNILSAPPSMLKILAKDVNEKRLTIKPKRLVSYAEVLEPDIQEEIEQAFHTKVHQIYQGSEGSFGMTCKHGSLHINEDLVKMQLLNADGSETTPGEPCYKLIVTDLHKKSQPVIRYELNDVVVISPEKCKCGTSFRTIQQIMGRTDDLFWGQREDTNESQFIFPDYIRRAIISSSDQIEEYQAVQKSQQKVLIRLILKSKDVNKEQLIETIQRSIQQVFTSYNCLIPSVDIRFERPMKNPNSDKLIRIQRDFTV